MSGSVAALDLGASSGRVVAGRITSTSIDSRVCARFTNRPVQIGNLLHWNAPQLWDGILDGVATALRTFPDIASLAVDTWGVDYGLFRHGRLLSLPVHYRDARTASHVARVQGRVAASEIYSITGIQDLPINTIYQLASDSDLVSLADNILLLPDLFTYWLSGVRIAEKTMASTTSLLDATSHDWNDALLQAAGVRRDQLPPLVSAGTIVGEITQQVAHRIGANQAINVIATGAHDTASAVVAVPLADDGDAYISCGTWGLVGMERHSPVLTEDARAAGFTNECGVDDRTLFMRNTMGLWMLSELVRHHERDHGSVDLTELLTQATAITSPLPIIDVDDPLFSPPGDMATRITQWCEARSMPAPQSLPAMARCIIESLAHTFSRVAHDAAQLSGTTLRRIIIVGGGSQNQLLCRLLASISGVEVAAGPAEATALGSMLVQARTMGFIDGDLGELRELVRRTHNVSVYNERSTPL
ncbi:rhamnulokinase [Microbacterium sp. YY-01]|uniref:rhamnulokinase n=1 Tax=Microbacterium sp. YY-01 TaxID=3421634 RepID=UPI003D16BDAE